MPTLQCSIFARCFFVSFFFFFNVSNQKDIKRNGTKRNETRSSHNNITQDAKNTTIQLQPQPKLDTMDLRTGQAEGRTIPQMTHKVIILFYLATSRAVTYIQRVTHRQKSAIGECITQASLQRCVSTRTSIELTELTIVNQFYKIKSTRAKTQNETTRGTATQTTHEPNLRGSQNQNP